MLCWRLFVIAGKHHQVFWCHTMCRSSVMYLLLLQRRCWWPWYSHNTADQLSQTLHVIAINTQQKDYATFAMSPVGDEERMRTGHWLLSAPVFHSVLWHYLFGGRKDIWLIKWPVPLIRKGSLTEEVKKDSWRNWIIQVDKKMKGVDSIGKVKHNKRSNQLLLEMKMKMAK